ncbi:MAG: translocation/assembly module TamB domain-containing protein [Gammaproteobacteria bacterium]
MAKTRTYLGRTALIASGILLLVVVGLVLYSRTEGFRDRLRDEVVAALNESIRGEIGLGRVQGSIWAKLVLSDLSVRYQGDVLLGVPRISVSYRLLPLLRGRLEIDSLRVVGVVMRAKQDAQGHWNVAEALSSGKPETEEGAGLPLTVALHEIVLRGRRIELRPPGGQSYHLTDTELDARVVLGPAGVAAEVSRLATRLTASGMPPVQMDAALAYQDSTAPATARVKRLVLATPLSRLRFAGALRDLKAPHVEATMLIDKVAAADVRTFVSDPGLKSDVTGSLVVRGPLSELRASLELAAARSRITGELRADVSGAEPRYAATARLARLDIADLLELQEMAGVVDGTLSARGSGASLDQLSAQAELKGQGLRLGDWQIGTAAIDTRLDHGSATLKGELRGELGKANWQGEVRLTKTPHYRLDLSVEHLDIKKLAAGAEPIEGDLNLKATISGKGLALADMNTRAEVDLLPSRVGPVQVRSGRLDAQIAEQRIRIDQGRLLAKDTNIAISGQVAAKADAPGALSYTVQMDDIGPWLALAGRQGSGRLELRGKAEGAIGDLAAQGELNAAALRLPDFSFKSGTVDFDISAIGRPQPRGTVTARLAGLKAANVGLRTLDANVTLAPAKTLFAQIAVKAQGTEARAHRLRLEVRALADRVAVDLKELRLALPGGVWQLAQPANVAKKGDYITIDNLSLVNGDQRLLADGTFSLSGGQDLRLQIERFDLASFRPLLEQPRLAGRLSVRAAIGGTAVAPRIAATGDVAQLTVGDQALAGVSTRLTYGKRRATFDLVVKQDAAHALNATASLPVALAWAGGFKAEAHGDLDASVRSTGLDLAVLNALADQGIRDVQGKLILDLRLRGPVSRPQPSGRFGLREGKATVEATGLTYADVTLLGTMGPDQIRIEQVSAQSRKGQIQGRGRVDIRDYRPQRVELSITATRWPAIWTRQYKAEIDLQVDAEGPLISPSVTGQAEVLHARLRPDLTILQDQPITPRDETIVVVQAEDRVKPAPQPQAKEPGLAESRLYEALALDFELRLARDTQVRDPNARVELTGDVRAKKPKGGPLSLVGAIDVEEGWAGFKGRRFAMERGRVVFTGGQKINPSLDIVAAHRASDYLIKVVIAGSAEEPKLDLESEPPLEQADILAVLLFGKPASELERGEKLDLQRQAASLAGSYAASAIGQSVSDALGLEALGVEMDFSGGQVGFQRYLTPKTRISISQDLVGGREGQEISIDYELAPGWELGTVTSSSGSGADIIWRKRY